MQRALRGRCRLTSKVELPMLAKESTAAYLVELIKATASETIDIRNSSAKFRAVFARNDCDAGVQHVPVDGVISPVLAHVLNTRLATLLQRRRSR